MALTAVAVAAAILAVLVILVILSMFVQVLRFIGRNLAPILFLGFIIAAVVRAWLQLQPY